MSLKPAFFIHLNVDEPQFVYSNQSGSLTLVKINDGYTKSLDPELKFDTEIIAGWDNLTTSVTTNNEVTTLDCQVFLKAKNGQIHMKYSGVVVPNDKTAAIFNKTSKTTTFDDAYVTAHPTFELDEKLVDEKWVKSKNLLGKGRFIRNEDNSLAVEYNFYYI